MDEQQTATAASPASDSPQNTLGDAAASLAAVDLSPSESSTPADTGAPAATAPDSQVATDPGSVTTDASAQPKAQGPIPFDVHKTALENARTKAAEEAKAAYAWAAEVPEAQRASFAQLYRALDSDPVGTLTSLIERVGANPQYQQQLQSQAARMLSAARANKPQEAPEPEADLQGPDGTLVYSAPQLKKWQEWNQAKLLTQVKQQLQPYEQMRTRAEQQQQSAQLWQQTKTQLEDMRQRPHFTDHEPAIRQLLVDNPSLSLEGAYIRVLTETVMPGLSAKTEADVVANLQQKAVASSHNPAAATTITPRNTLGDARAALEEAERLMGAR